MSEHDREILASALTILVHNVRGFNPTPNKYLFTNFDSNTRFYQTF